MSIATAPSMTDRYRLLSLTGYRPVIRATSSVVSESQARRATRQARREEEAARHAEMSSSLVRAIATLALSTAIGIVAFARIGAAYDIPEATGQGAPAGTALETAGEEATGSEVTSEIFVQADNTGIEGWTEPDISGDCPVVWERTADGGFQNTNGAVLGSECKFGVDVSDHDGLIDWEAAKANGVEFAIIRCGFGSDREEHDDLCWERNVSECERLGIPYGTYLYSYVTEPESAISEAEHVIRLVKGHEIPLGVWYDVEESTQAEAMGYDSQLFGELVDTFASEVESKTGLKVGVYTSRSWLDEHMSEVAADPDRPIWCACWTDYCPEGVRYDYWQAGAAAIPGFETEVDFDVILG